jgi:hypothetical protein
MPVHARWFRRVSHAFGGVADAERGREVHRARNKYARDVDALVLAVGGFGNRARRRHGFDRLPTVAYPWPVFEVVWWRGFMPDQWARRTRRIASALVLKDNNSRASSGVGRRCAGDVSGAAIERQNSCRALLQSRTEM